MLGAVALVALFGCTKRGGEIAAPQRVDEALRPTSTSLPFAEGATTTLGATTTTTTSAAATSSTSVAPTTRASASSTTRTTAAPTSTATTMPSTPRRPPNITLTVAESGLPCPTDQRAFSAVWSIGDATSGTGRLAFGSETPRPVPDSGREDRCVAFGSYVYTYTATGPGGSASRGVTFSFLPKPP